VIGASALGGAILLSVGIYLMLSGNVQRVALGFVLLSNGINLLVVTSAGLPQGASVPIWSLAAGAPADAARPPERPADPLAQAFVLTAIVIGLGAAAFLLAVGARTREETGSDDLAEAARDSAKDDG
jgi:multicomponent Na+:H+ antiporter subunit C